MVSENKSIALNKVPSFKEERLKAVPGGWEKTRRVWCIAGIALRLATLKKYNLPAKIYTC